MTRSVLIALFLLSLTVSLRGSNPVFTLGKEEFLLNGKPFRIISGELHPARIPAEYWRHRIRMTRAMGCNTIACYIFWNYHEASPGLFDFTTGNRNLTRFLNIAREEGMWVLFRPGPYVCAEWDFGGLPSWLLRIPDIKIRCMDRRYSRAVERYIRTLALLVRDYQVHRGGPILMVQLENEYGSYGNDRKYMEWLRELWIGNGIGVPFYTADGPTPYMLEAGSLPGVAVGLDPGSNQNHFDAAAKANPGVPSFCSELYPGWLTHWGEKWQRPDTGALLRDVRWLMDHNKSFNFYVIHGGTNFGFWAGANAFSPDSYQPDVTSYDYDAPIDEAGRATPKYHALRNLIASYLPPSRSLPPIPDAPPMIDLAPVAFTASASLWDNLPPSIRSPQPKPMEMFGQQGGSILYGTRLTGHKKGKLRITGLHDYATVFVDGTYVGKLDRCKAENIIELPSAASPFPLLEILVEGMGRINFAEYMIDRKGITERVSLNGMTLMDWQITPLPMDEEYLGSLRFTPRKVIRPGNFFRGTFELETTGDTYLDLTDWEKGMVWVNGHNLGRFWNIGPQKQLFCPAPWLKTGTNEIIVFDFHLLDPPSVKGVRQME